MKKLLIIMVLVGICGVANACRTDWGCVNRCRLFGGTQDSCLQTCTVCY